MAPWLDGTSLANMENDICRVLEIVFMEKILKNDFQNEDSILLLHGSLVKSNFDGLTSPKSRFS